MSQNVMQDLPSHLQAGNSIEPGTSLSGTTAANGASVDTRGMTGPIGSIASAGDATGSPTSYTATVKLQESDDGSSNWADIANQRAAVLDADRQVKCGQAHHTKRYVRAVATPAFTGGSAPTLPVGVHVGGHKTRI